MLTHVYALVRSARAPKARALPDGLPGGEPVRLVPAGPAMWLVVSSVPASDYGQDALARGVRELQWVTPRAVAHERVVGHFLCAPAVLPMQLFTLFESDERALEHVARDRQRIERILDRIGRHAEWGVRLTWDARAARAAAASTTRPASGAAYLSHKRDTLEAGRGRQAAARAVAECVYDALAREAADARRHGDVEHAPGSPVLLDAAFLVSSRRGAAFRAALRRHEAVMRESAIEAALTGPWAAYNFV
jgi:hypothetical protein